MICCHGIESGACEECDEDVLKSAAESVADAEKYEASFNDYDAYVERRSAGIILAARLRTVERWDESTAPEYPIDNDRRQTRLDKLRTALDDVLTRMGLLEQENAR